jgi:hypothetical protein
VPVHKVRGLEFRTEEQNNHPGTNLMPGQIPDNMQMDLNRLCLERELEKFIDSGAAEDAYSVCCCYLEMYFGHYGNRKRWWIGFPGSSPTAVLCS